MYWRCQNHSLELVVSFKFPYPRGDYMLYHRNSILLDPILRLRRWINCYSGRERRDSVMDEWLWRLLLWIENNRYSCQTHLPDSTVSKGTVVNSVRRKTRVVFKDVRLRKTKDRKEETRMLNSLSSTSVDYMLKPCLSVPVPSVFLCVNIDIEVFPIIWILLW